MEYDEIVVGTEIPHLTQKVTIMQTVMYCGITWDFARQHYDQELAQSLGFDRPVVDPQMYGAFLARMLTDWISIKARLKRLTVRYTAPSYLGDVLKYTGKVAKKYEKELGLYINRVIESEKKSRIKLSGIAGG